MDAKRMVPWFVVPAGAFRVLVLEPVVSMLMRAGPTTFVARSTILFQTDTVQAVPV
jgi:hypothetical protein